MKINPQDELPKTDDSFIFVTKENKAYLGFFRKGYFYKLTGASKELKQNEIPVSDVAYWIKQKQMNFLDLKEGDTVYYTQKGSRFQTTLAAIKDAKGFSFKTQEGQVVTMSKKEAEANTYKDQWNTLWEVRAVAKTENKKP